MLRYWLVLFLPILLTLAMCPGLMVAASDPNVAPIHVRVFVTSNCCLPCLQAVFVTHAEHLGRVGNLITVSTFVANESLKAEYDSLHLSKDIYKLAVIDSSIPDSSYVAVILNGRSTFRHFALPMQEFQYQEYLDSLCFAIDTVRLDQLDTIEVASSVSPEHKPRFTPNVRSSSNERIFYDIAGSTVSFYDAEAKRFGAANLASLLPDSISKRHSFPPRVWFLNDTTLQMKLVTGNAFVDTIIHGEEARYWYQKSVWDATYTRAGSSIFLSNASTMQQQRNFNFVWGPHDGGVLCVPGTLIQQRSRPTHFEAAVCDVTSGRKLRTVVDSIPVEYWPRNDYATCSMADTFYFIGINNNLLRSVPRARHMRMPIISPYSHSLWRMERIHASDRCIAITFFSTTNNRAFTVICTSRGTRVQPVVHHLQSQIVFLKSSYLLVLSAGADQRDTIFALRYPLLMK